MVRLRSPGIRDSATITDAIDIHSKAWGMSWDQFHELIADKTHPRRLHTLAEMAEVAVFMASDRASAMTWTVVSMSNGNFDD